MKTITICSSIKNLDTIKSTIKGMKACGYIGTMVTAEIGYALGQNKAVFFSEKSGRIELDALASGIISLDKLEEFNNL